MEPCSKPAVLEEGATKTHNRIDARGDLEELYQATDQDHISSVTVAWIQSG